MAVAAVQGNEWADTPRLGNAWLPMAWILIVLLFSTQWYAYDGSRGTASPYLYYLGWSCLMWALAPLVLWFARRHPLRARAWKHWLALHFAASVALSALQVLAEALVKWARISQELSFQAIASHYVLQHVQLYLLTYWALLAVAEFLRLHNQVNQRQLRATQLEVQLSAARLEALHAQLQPHFLFNTLQTAVILLHENPHAAEEVLLNLSALLRASLSEFRTNEVPLRKELQFLSCYVDIQRHRFGKRLHVELDIDRTTLDFAVPSLVLQPLVENAIRHGVGAHKGSDVVAVRAMHEEGQLRLEVQNHNSTLGAPLDELVTRGVGLANTRARLRQLYGEDQALRLFTLQPRGVCVRVTLPAHKFADAGANELQPS